MSMLRDVWGRISNIFTEYLEQERAITETEVWDGSAARFESTEEYCNACLINVNPASGREDPDDWAQSHCMLPVRDPGDGSDVYVDKAVFAAVGGRGIAAVAKPDDVSDDAWEDAVKSAANQIISAYQQMDMVAPDSVYSIADREPPEERAVSWGMLVSQADEQAWNANMWLHEMYLDDDGATYAIASSEGKLYRALVAVSDGEVLVGEWEQVETQHVPVARNITITRQADGVYRWAGVACTAVLNKNAEIDSSVLFGKFVERFQKRVRENKPVPLDFWHEDIFLGEVDYIDTDGYALVASGVFRDDEIGRTVAQNILDDPGSWGQSICYRPLAEPTYLEVHDGMSIPVWEDGELERVALLPSNRASAWFTTFNTRNVRSRNMRAEIMEALIKLVGEDQAQNLASQVDGVNERVAGEQLIAREASDEEEQETVEEEQEEETGVEVSPEVQAVREIRADQAGIKATLEAITVTLNQLVPDVNERLANLERTEQERREAWVADMPAVQARTIVRPREVRSKETEEQISTEDRVHATLAAKGIVK